MCLLTFMLSDQNMIDANNFEIRKAVDICLVTGVLFLFLIWITAAFCKCRRDVQRMD